MKECSRCGQLKDESEFWKYKRLKCGLMASCRQCNKKTKVKYVRTIQGVVVKLYNHQIENSKKRSHELPSYSEQELYEWLNSQDLFHKLFNEWVSCEYDTNKKPSVDRKDDYKPYSFDNIQIMTWEQNRNKYYSDRRNGINNKGNKTVLQYDLNGVFIEEYISIAQAKRETGVSNSVISKCCKGEYKTAGSYIWKYKCDE